MNLKVSLLCNMPGGCMEKIALLHFCGTRGTEFPFSTEHIKGKGYNICCDNFFTSLPLAEKLQQAKLSLVGTIRKNRRDLSKVMTEPHQGCVNSSKFCNTHLFPANLFAQEKWRNVCIIPTKIYRNSLSFIHHAFYT